MKTIKIKIQKYKKAKIKDFIFISTMVKADIFRVKEKKIKFINKKDDIRFFFKKFKFFNLEILYFIDIFV